MWRRGTLGLFLLALAACAQEPAAAPAPPPTEPIAADAVAQGRQPKPGERVRQPLLDDHCAELTAPIAFYYHGGRPFSQRAVGDGCRPLYITECKESGECSQNSEQEQGMWCCGDPAQQAAVHAERR